MGHRGTYSTARGDGPTAREAEILTMIVNENASNPTIARSLGISVRTAKFHVSNLLREYGVRRRGDLIVLAGLR